jgi:hypothetical protein
MRNDLFLRGGLDTPNQIEFAEQIKFCVKSHFGLACSMRSAIAAPDLPVEANQCPATLAVRCFAGSCQSNRGLAAGDQCFERRLDVANQSPGHRMASAQIIAFNPAVTVSAMFTRSQARACIGMR